jgi:hypothetical protein
MYFKCLIKCAGICLAVVSFNTSAATIFTDDFESGNLDNWTIGGRQSGIHTANVVVADTGSLAGHLYQNGSFTEITMSRDFTYDPIDTFSLDLKVDVSSQPPPSSNYYGISGVAFHFLDSSDTILGSVWYLASTTDYPLNNWVNPARNVNMLSENVWHQLVFDIPGLLSQISINESDISKTQMMFETYSSTWPYPRVSAELWVDNVSVPAVPLPGAIWLFGFGLIGLIGIARRKQA